MNTNRKKIEKMKKILLLLSIFCTTIAFAKTQETLAKFIITESTKNGYDNTAFDIDRGGYFVFYINKDNKLCFGNIAEHTELQSFGLLIGMKIDKIDETATTFKTDIYNYRWKYYNNYDNATGYATVQCVKIYKPQGVIFELVMILPNLDKLTYKGYMDGTLDLENF
jgi:hypothetical protein